MGKIEIFADDQSIFITEPLVTETKPIQFDLDITGAEMLTIVFSGEYGDKPNDTMADPPPSFGIVEGEFY